MVLIAQIALGVIIGGVTLALLAMSFFIWNSRQRDERMAIGLFIAGVVIVLVLVVIVSAY
jgi:lipopolysaccharide export LptBFGC system permease protein LptF